MRYKAKCKGCGYKWEARVPNPKKCPYCQAWLNKPKNVETKSN